MPDVFVPVDTSFYSSYLDRATNLGLMYRFAFYYTDLHRNELKDLQTAGEIAEHLDEEPLLKEFVQYASSKGLSPDPDGMKPSREFILAQVKAYIARNIIDNKGYYPLVKDVDNTLLVAIDTIANM